MSCDHLICARCAGPVAEQRCPSCRATRAHWHGSEPYPGFNVILVTLVVALLLAIALHFSIS